MTGLVETPNVQRLLELIYLFSRSKLLPKSTLTSARKAYRCHSTGLFGSWSSWQPHPLSSSSWLWLFFVSKLKPTNTKVRRTAGPPISLSVIRTLIFRDCVQGKCQLILLQLMNPKSSIELKVKMR